MASSSQIKPGETGSVAAEVNTADFKGAIVKEIWVYSNDPQKPRVEFTIKADVQTR
jgi:hypothetical protein